MSRFVFREATPEMLECAMPLHAELAVLRMEWALTKLARKAGFDPTQPRVPAGNADGGKWTDADGGVRVAANDRGGISVDAASRFVGHESPEHIPPGVNVDRNIAEAEKHDYPLSALVDYPELQLDTALWFYRQVNDGGPWDYKLQGPDFEDFGNFNYGATGKAPGFSEETLLRMAGVKQGEDHHSRPGWGVPVSIFEALLGVGGVAPFGHDPRDQLWIKRGFQYYDSVRRMRRS